MPIRVTIFEDRDLLREVISLLVERTEGLVLAGAYPDCSNLELHIFTSKPDVVLMDIEMPGMNGVEAVKVIRQKFPTVKVLMQTVFEDDDKVFNAICNGASGYVLKKTAPDRLMEYIKEVWEGGAPMSPSIARKTLQLFQQYLAPVNEEKLQNYHISPREKQVLQSMVKGYSYKMIADDLSISYDTVRSHIRHIYEKLHVACLSEAVAKALKERLV